MRDHVLNRTDMAPVRRGHLHYGHLIPPYDGSGSRTPEPEHSRAETAAETKGTDHTGEKAHRTTVVKCGPGVMPGETLR